MAVTLYSSTDASAPTMTGQAGKVITLLDACLVNGYGAKSPVGWTKSFSGTNKAVYRPPAGNQHYLRIDDSTTTYARIIGYETMSDVDTGTGLFPTAAQLSGGLYLQKSVAADATVRNWWMVANDKLFILVIDYDSALNQGQFYLFGTVHSYVTNDAYHSLIIGNAANNNANTFGLVPANDTLNTGHYLARRWDNLSSAIQCGKVAISGIYPSNTYSGASTQTMTYPDPATGGLHVTGLYVYENSLSKMIRGRIPGVWFIAHNQPFTHLDTLTGAAGTELEGKSFLFLKIYSIAAILLETSDTWYNVGF